MRGLIRRFTYWWRTKRVETDRYRYTHNAGENWPICTFHVSEWTFAGPSDIMSFRNWNSQPNRQPKFVRELFGIKGVAFIELHPFDILIGKADVYEWKELIGPVEAIIRQYLEELTTPLPEVELPSVDEPLGPDGDRFGEPLTNVVEKVTAEMSRAYSSRECPTTSNSFKG